jgi:hypothetical protein
MKNMLYFYCSILYYIMLYYNVYFAMSGRSHSYVGVHLGHKYMALEVNTQNQKNFGDPFTNKGLIFLHILVFPDKNYVGRYIRITSTKSPSFSMITCSAILTNSRVLLDLTRDYSCYGSRRIMAPAPL